MPCTFSHPLAVAPLHRLCQARLNFAALIIGSMSPDFAYYVRPFPAARFAHTVLGTVTVCLPAGLLALGAFYALRQPVCFVLPQPHRAALMPLASIRPRISLRSFLIAAVSVLLGAWTHTIWDSFTHDGGWSVQHIPILRAPLIHIAGTALPTSYVLQQLSTFGAGAALALMYFLWLRRQPIAPLPAQGSLCDGWRYFLLGLIAVIALCIAAPAALRMASLFEGYTAFRVFVFRTGFKGECEAAFKFYERCLGGQFGAIFRYAGTPLANQVPADWQDKIMHGSLKLGDQVLMGGDVAPDRYGEPKGFSLSLSLQIKSTADAERIFHEFAKDGKVMVPLEKTFWADRFGMVVDRFGIPWLINCEGSDQPPEA